MKILFVNAYFEPETIAFTHLERDLLEGLVAAGHEVEIICPTPTRGVTADIRRRYRRTRTEKLHGGRVTVRRFYAPREGKNPLLRAMRYLWCALREYQIGRRYRQVDAVFTVSTPPIQGLVAGLLSRRLNCRFVYSLQDVFPDSLVTSGLTRQGSTLWKVGRYIERKTYGYAEKIIVISDSCRKNLLTKGVSREKIELISNWVDIEKIKPIPRHENQLVDEFDLDPRKFLAVYAGNFGASQGAEIIIKAAEILRGEPDVHFVIFGGGSRFDAAKSYVTEKDLSNVTLSTLMPQSRVAEVYSLGDVALVTCKAGVSSSGMPSKIWSIMACGTPIIASFDTESDLATVLSESSGGICVEPENAAALAEAILRMKNSPERRGKSREYVESHADKEMCVARYVDVIVGKAR